MQSILDLLIPAAFAQTAAQPAEQGGGFSLFIMFAIFFVFLYLFMWRPQSKRAKEQQQLMESIAKGDEVMTAGGLLGRVNKISGQYISLSIASNVDIVMQKSSVVSVMPKGTLKTIE